MKRCEQRLSETAVRGGFGVQTAFQRVLGALVRKDVEEDKE